MAKKIAIQKGLDDLKNSLKSKGYEVYDINENKEVEAIIYMADGYSIPYMDRFISMDAGFEIDRNKEVLLINATGKTLEEIEYIINNRLYSPLFE
ncbi:YkuS family protein [Caloranaerobacter ferrireducens]|uniref:YkuS family protein n=1 Tax=Caloranaerobacter ferrireducens TaxID=1323370 RepID=UPI00084D79AE|nr:YkuS family protein [Caloranaerobacter ferrireducens]